MWYSRIWEIYLWTMIHVKERYCRAQVRHILEYSASTFPTIRVTWQHPNLHTFFSAKLTAASCMAVGRKPCCITIYYIHVHVVPRGISVCLHAHTYFYSSHQPRLHAYLHISMFLFDASIYITYVVCHVYWMSSYSL